MTCLKLAALGLHLASQHTTGGYNNLNPGVYARTECGLIAGTYYNSQRRHSAYVGYTYEPRKLPVFAALALTTGYSNPRTGHRYAIVPIPMAGVRVPLDDAWQVKLGVIPKIKPSDTYVAHLMIERRF